MREKKIFTYLYDPNLLAYKDLEMFGKNDVIVVGPGTQGLKQLLLQPILVQVFYSYNEYANYRPNVMQPAMGVAKGKS